MLTLTYGYKKPQTGDRGVPFFTAMEDNIQRLNDHTHNGSDAALLSAQSIVGIETTILAVNWVVHGATGFYRQLITSPAGIAYDTVQISFRLADRSYVFPTIERVSAAQYYIYTIDNTLAYFAVYGG